MKLPDSLLNDIRTLIESTRSRVATAVNAELTLLYWKVGQRISIDVLGEKRAEYGEGMIPKLANQLTVEYGRGWGERHLRNCVRFASVFSNEKIVHTLCSELSWSHFRLVASMEDPLKRDFYIELARMENWSVRQLQERIQSMLYERSAISKKPAETIQHDLKILRKEGRQTPDLIFKDPYILDFLGLNDHYHEKDLEDAILREMEQFLLELGSGFTFVARQKRIQIDDEDFYIDLLFYNRKLKRLVAIELKLGAFKAEYKGQMELYLRWLARHDQESDENPPLGIILCADKKQEQIELLELDQSGIHVAEYLTVLPPREHLQQRLQRSLQNARQRLLGYREANSHDARKK